MLFKYKFLALLSVITILNSCSEEKETLEQKQAKVIDYKQKITELEKEISEMSAGKEEVVQLKPVTVFDATPITFNHFVDVPGDVTSNRNVVVAPETTGRLLKRYVAEGAYVKRGQYLAKLDVELVQKQIDEINTNLELANVLYEKQDKLWKQGIGSEVQYLQAKNNKESLEAKLASLKEQEGKGYVIAPISGKIDEIFMKEGEMAPAGQPYARIVDLSRIEVVAEVSEAYSRVVKKGDKVLVRFPMLDIERNMHVDVVGQTINQMNRTFKIRMRIAERGLNIKPNTMAIVRINDFSEKNAVAIPSNLVQKNTKGETFTYVLTAKGGKQNVVTKVPVITGKSYQGKTLITEGIEANARVIDKGYSEVINGEQVRIVDYQI
ncbi:efflux RND transporter periplasmic adaptor subunit [Flammeovirga kamogawensis]|uniref:Efflux RND transporter periplasmic adaptor subunit n=1 Tax=Flammeovirga kamogawensis TaxID=373891 RepID=A0ABX8GSE4_9BACT|nr:efflux RND transporter periplasmic adaptor subunit [Flammeovirga kamogawensis]MBB6462983.1 RND family efflux transporter MFP subunit [Flammeovirga kamogawensis]QWG06508.1 efflux RND transporter periplasmic adaptor subunit [Flammeovirga kamogawensis]TRX68336.1 efflux RND transporter periplasmic adaptor subunit [Flammeovirga kamogawensis]